MSEIIKLYENAGIVPKKNCYYWDCPYSTGNVGEDDKKEKDCENCNNPDKKTYPPLNAEKQIELIKWLAIKGDYFNYTVDIAKNTYDYWTIYFQGARCTATGFEESLAGLINILWQSLTEEEKQQVKNILEE